MAPQFAHSGLDAVIPLYKESQNALYPELCKTKRSNEYYYRSAQEGDLSQASPITEGRGITYQEFQTPYMKDWTPLKYGVGFAVSTEAEETDYYGVIAKKTKKMVQSLEWAKNVDMADFFNLATSSTFTGPDGVALASASHPIAGGTTSNIIVSGGTSNPALGYTALESAWQQALTCLTYQGNYMPYMGPFNLWVAPAQAAFAERLLGTDGIAGTFNLDPSTVKKRFSKVVVNPYFSSTTAWAVRCSRDDEHGLVQVLRRDNVSKSQYAIDFDADKFTLTAIWCKAIDDWRGYWYSSGLGV
jgi:hypothetical protein